MEIKKGTIVLRKSDMNDKDLSPLHCFWLITSFGSRLPTAVDIDGVEMSKGLAGELIPLVQTKGVKSVAEALKLHYVEIISALIKEFSK